MVLPWLLVGPVHDIDIADSATVSVGEGVVLKAFTSIRTTMLKNSVLIRYRL